ncbi:MAG: Fic family protein [Flavobacteriales bacterium]|nr:Fic family protein [Flavobacteriales bacterium]
MELLTDKYLPAYTKRQRLTLEKHLARLARKGARAGDATRWATLAGAVASSQIEGSRVTVDEFVEATSNGKRRTRDVQEVEDLVRAYGDAQRTALTKANLLKAHATLASTIYSKKGWTPGAWRTGAVYVVGSNLLGRYKIYEGPPAADVPKLMDRLMREVSVLNKATLTPTEAFYYAALLHLQFVKIHPYNDGNGRAGRLLEKWFLAKHVGPAAWLVNSELYYRNHLQQYYDALRRLGPDWSDIDMDECVPFLLLLPKGLRQK